MKILDVLMGMKREGLTIPDTVIMLLLHQKPRAVKDLANECDVCHAQASRSLGRLLKDQYVTYTGGEDRREKIYALSQQGENAIQRAFQ